MKRGFISIHTLLLLEKAPSHGYKIIQDIETHTMGIWKPAISTMYTVLKNLKKKGLIELSKTIEDERGKKVYEITPKGEETLQLLLKKRRKFREAMKSMIAFSFNLNEEFIDMDIENLLPIEELTSRVKELSKDEKLKQLKIQKQVLETRISRKKELLLMIQKKIKKLEDTI